MIQLCLKLNTSQISYNVWDDKVKTENEQDVALTFYLSSLVLFCQILRILLRCVQVVIVRPLSSVSSLVRFAEEPQMFAIEFSDGCPVLVSFFCFMLYTNNHDNQLTSVTLTLGLREHIPRQPTCSYSRYFANRSMYTRHFQNVICLS